VLQLNGEVVVGDGEDEQPLCAYLRVAEDFLLQQGDGEQDVL
jgi:hypothetical protein